MQDNQEKCKELAIRIYNLDEEVYKCVGSSLGRTFTGQKETTLRHLAALMYTKPDGHLLRSELALISNMARTIRDKSERRRLMIEYDSILKEIESLPDTFGQTDIVDKERISLNNLIARRQNEISENDHLIICISRTQGSGGNDIGFDDDSDITSTTVLTNASKSKPGPVIVRTRTGERIKIDKPIFCIGKSAQGVDYQVTDNNSVSRRHAYIINVNGVYYLRDNKSTNHTYLGGKIINSGTDMMLIDGSKFKLANEEFTFREK